MPQPLGPDASYQATFQTLLTIEAGKLSKTGFRLFRLKCVEMYDTGQWADALIPAASDEDLMQFKKPKSYWMWFEYVCDNAKMSKTSRSLIGSLITVRDLLIDAGETEAFDALDRGKQDVATSALRAIKRKKIPQHSYLVSEIITLANDKTRDEFKEEMRKRGLVRDQERLPAFLVAMAGDRQVLWLEVDDEWIKRLKALLSINMGTPDQLTATLTRPPEVQKRTGKVWQTVFIAGDEMEAHKYLADLGAKQDDQGKYTLGETEYRIW